MACRAIGLKYWHLERAENIQIEIESNLENTVRKKGR